MVIAGHVTFYPIIITKLWILLKVGGSSKVWLTYRSEAPGAFLYYESQMSPAVECDFIQFQSI